MQLHQDPERHTDLKPISLQGIFVLLFHCVTHREVRKHLRAVLAGKKLHLDDSATTRATLLTVGGAGDPSSPGLRAGGRVGSCKDQTNYVSWALYLSTHHTPQGKIIPEVSLSNCSPTCKGFGGARAEMYDNQKQCPQGVRCSRSVWDRNVSPLPHCSSLHLSTPPPCYHEGCWGHADLVASAHQ